MSTMKKGSTRRSDDTMDDDSDDKDSKRKSRNLSEKKRRDQFNLLVNELSSIVSTGGRKMDKSTVLKSTISFLKTHNELTVRSRINEIQEDWKPAFLTNEEFTHLVLESVDGFIMVFSVSGHIYYVSESIASLLGHLPRDVLNMTIYELASEEEQTNLYNILLSPSEDEKQVVFSCYLRRGGLDTKSPPTYELIEFVGYFRSDKDLIQSENRYSGYSGEADTRLVFLGTGKLQTPQLIKELPLVESVKSEFTSRHSLEWKFLFLDHRAPPIIGYLPFELLGTSGYDYYHVDDLEKVVSCHEALLQKGEGTSCFYRFLTKGQQWIWLQTRFYITYHQWNSKPEFIVCTHKVVSYTDIMKLRNREANGTQDTNFDSQEGSSPSMIRGSSFPQQWPGSSNSGEGSSSARPRSASECTSMSADSPGPRHSTNMRAHHINQSVISQSNTVLPHHQQSQFEQHTIAMHLPQPVQVTQFLEPPEYVTAIPTQSIVTSFPTSAVLSPLQSVDNVVLSSAQSQLQADLQRKHAELQAMIGQQQQELRRVSEQLLMTRLGLLPESHHQSLLNVPVSYQTNNTCSISSTTTTVQGMQSSITGPASVIVPVSVPICLPLQHYQHQPNLIYNTPDSNTQTKLI